ncbi:unnamed protein product [Amoebophrya sp. A120]|nr:unnamed protein product [Amoebophrya sp. A120]|eukprot:GSA120T00009943001.1
MGLARGGRRFFKKPAAQLGSVWKKRKRWPGCPAAYLPGARWPGRPGGWRRGPCVSRPCLWSQRAPPSVWYITKGRMPVAPAACTAAPGRGLSFSRGCA